VISKEQQDRNRGIDDAEEGRPQQSGQSRAYNQGYVDGLSRLRALGWTRAERVK
jgi:hypothetical protein